MSMFTEDKLGNLTIKDAALTASVLAGNFELTPKQIQNNSAYAGICRQLVKHGFIDPKEDGAIDVKQTFRFSRDEFRSYLGVFYPAIEVEYEAGHCISNIMQIQRDLKEKSVPDYDK